MQQLHTNDEILDQYALGKLSGERVSDVEEHLLTCESCQSRLHAADEFALLFREAAVQPDARPQRGWRVLWGHRAARWTAAAAAMAAILLVFAGPFQKPSAIPATVLMQALRGPESATQVAAGKPAYLVFDIAAPEGLDQYEARVVNPTGGQILAGKISARDGHMAVYVNSLPQGSYWVRIYRGDDREPMGEYGLRAK